MKAFLNNQYKAITHLHTKKVGALFKAPGTGKTRTAVELIKQVSPDYVLWLAPFRSVNPKVEGTGIQTEVEKYRIIDGYHRYETLKRMGSEEVLIVDLKIKYHQAMQLTVLMNRIKGMHKVEKMSDIIVKLEDMGMTDDEICKNLGMEAEEYLRLKHQLGIPHAFRNHEYSNSWEVK